MQKKKKQNNFTDLRTSDSTGSQQIDDVYVISQVNEDFQLGHQCLFLRGMSACCEGEISKLWLTKFDLIHLLKHLHMYSMAATMQMHQLITEKGCSLEPSRHLHSLHFSILTATVIVESALASPYAVASTTFPNAPDPSVFPKDMTDTKLLFSLPFPLPQCGLMPTFLGQQQSYPEGWVHRHQDTQDPV